MTEEDILKGLPIIISNAESVYYDAVLLEKGNRIARAYSLFQLSLEEIAKAFMLLGAILFEDISDNVVQKRLKKEIQKHDVKLKKSIGIEIFLSTFMESIDNEKYKDWVIKLNKEYKDIEMMNRRKNFGFYVSFNQNEFRSPNELIKKEDVEKIKNTAWTRIHFGSKIIKAMIPNFSKIKAQAKDVDFSKIKK